MSDAILFGNTQEIKTTLFNWTKRDKTCKFCVCHSIPMFGIPYLCHFMFGISYLCHFVFGISYLYLAFHICAISCLAFHICAILCLAFHIYATVCLAFHIFAILCLAFHICAIMKTVSMHGKSVHYVMNQMFCFCSSQAKSECTPDVSLCVDVYSLYVLMYTETLCDLSTLPPPPPCFPL